MAEYKWPEEGAAGSGDVVGPGSSTNDAIARFDGTSGKLIQNSTVTLSDAGVMAGATIDGDDNTVQDLPLTALKTVLGDATEVLRRDSSGIVVSGPMTVTGTGDTNGIKTVDVRNDDDLTADNTWMIRLENRNASTTSHPHIEMRRGGAANADLANGDTIGGFDFHPRHNASSLSTAKFEAFYTGDGTTRLADFVWSTSNAGVPAERMRLKANGDLNIVGLTASRALVTDADNDLVSSATTATEIGHVSGVTSAIQTQLNGKQATGDYITALTGDVTASGPGSAAATLADAGTAGTYVKVTTDAKGRVTSGVAGPQAIADGGTGQATATTAFDALAPTTTLGDAIYHNGTDNVRLAGNTTTTRKFLRQTGDGVNSAAPVWDTLVVGDLPVASAGSAGAISYYREDTISTGWVPNGIGSSGSTSFTVFITRIGNIVTLTFDSTSDALPAGTTTILNSSTDLPAWAYPAAGVIAPVYVRNNSSTYAVGVLEVSTAGNLALWRDVAQTAFTNGAAAGGYGNISVSYSV